MSLDNGIYVLLTESEKGTEYRVTYASAIDNIYGEWNPKTGKYDGNLVSLKETFLEAPLFHSLNEALDAAEAIENESGETEDGVCVINEFKSYGFIFD